MFVFKLGWDASTNIVNHQVLPSETSLTKHSLCALLSKNVLLILSDEETAGGTKYHKFPKLDCLWYSVFVRDDTLWAVKYYIVMRDEGSIIGIIFTDTINQIYDIIDNFVEEKVIKLPRV